MSKLNDLIAKTYSRKLNLEEIFRSWFRQGVVIYNKDEYVLGMWKVGNPPKGGELLDFDLSSYEGSAYVGKKEYEIIEKEIERTGDANLSSIMKETPLEKELEKAFIELNISKENEDSLKYYLDPVKSKDRDTYNHCVRVSLLGIKVARHKAMDEKALFYPGLLHDTGKAFIDSSILKKENLNEEEMKEMKKHVEYSHHFVSGPFEFSARVIALHHKYQEKSYPEKMPESAINIELSPQTEEKIKICSRYLAIIDKYDAGTSRLNNRAFEIIKTYESFKNYLCATNPDQKELINDLYACGIFKRG